VDIVYSTMSTPLGLGGHDGEDMSVKILPHPYVLLDKDLAITQPNPAAETHE